jgi:hypothetical protein
MKTEVESREMRDEVATFNPQRSSAVIVPATAEHIPAIAADLREADREELRAVGCMDPLDCMFHGLAHSEKAWTGLIDEEPVCMFGAVPASILGNVGRPWMVGTNRLDKHPLVFLRRCKREGCLGEMRERFDVLTNYVDVRNTRAIEWLMWLGFDVRFEPVRIGPYKMPFLRFEMRGLNDVGYHPLTPS